MAKTVVLAEFSRGFGGFLSRHQVGIKRTGMMLAPLVAGAFLPHVVGRFTNSGPSGLPARGVGIAGAAGAIGGAKMLGKKPNLLLVLGTVLGATAAVSELSWEGQAHERAVGSAGAASSPAPAPAQAHVPVRKKKAASNGGTAPGTQILPGS
jgi:hypothetical protein